MNAHPAYPAPAAAFSLSAPVRLWEDGFAADPHAYYAALRAQGPVGWAELAPGVPAYVVTDRRAALDLLHDPDTWSHDPRPWEATVAADSPILGMMRWRPNALFADGDATSATGAPSSTPSTWSSRTTCASGCTGRWTSWWTGSDRPGGPTWSRSSPGP